MGYQRCDLATHALLIATPTLLLVAPAILPFVVTSVAIELMASSLGLHTTPGLLGIAPSILPIVPTVITIMEANVCSPPAAAAIMQATEGGLGIAPQLFPLVVIVVTIICLTGFPSMLATPFPFALRPVIFPVLLIFVAIELQGCRGHYATSRMILATPLLLVWRPPALPVFPTLAAVIGVA